MGGQRRPPLNPADYPLLLRPKGGTSTHNCRVRPDDPEWIDTLCRWGFYRDDAAKGKPGARRCYGCRMMRRAFLESQGGLNGEDAQV